MTPFLIILNNGIKPETRAKPDFWHHAKFVAGSVLGIFLFGYTNIFFNFFYTSSQGWVQTLVALGLPALKFLARTTQEWWTSNSPNPDAAHTASMFIDAATATTKSFMMFSATNERTLILLVLFDIIEVLYYFVRTIHRLINCLTNEIDHRTKQAKVALSLGDEVSSLSLSAQLDHELQVTHKELAMALIAKDPETQYIAVSMFFCEVVEFILPLMMTIAALVLYYFPTSIRSQMMNLAELSDEVRVRMERKRSPLQIPSLSPTP